MGFFYRKISAECREISPNNANNIRIRVIVLDISLLF